MNRIWKLLSKKKSPPLLPSYLTEDNVKGMRTYTLVFDIQLCMGKQFVIDDVWLADNHESMWEIYKNPSPWQIVGAFRESAYNDAVVFLMVPWPNEKAFDYKNAIRVPSDMVGIKAVV